MRWLSEKRVSLIVACRGWLSGRAAPLLVGLVLAVVYTPVIAQMVWIWQTHQYAGHGMFVPAFSLFVLWTDRDRLRAAVGRGHRAGIAVILVGLAVLWLGWWVDSLFLKELSIVAAVAGLVLWGFGTGCLRAAAFPVGFLVLMVPPPLWLVDAVTQDLQLFAARFAELVLDRLDVPFFVEGVLIQLPGITLAVAEVCNGLRFLLALLVLTIALAQVTQRSVPRKLILAASAIPIAIVANAIRVAAVALAVYHIGPSAAQGFIHNYIGKSVWALTLVPLAILALVLRRGGAGRRLEASRPLAVPRGKASP
jgi:exosortase